MKNLFLLLFAVVPLLAAAQQKPLTKAETVAYIEKTFRANYDDSEAKITLFSVEGKVLSWQNDKGKNTRHDLGSMPALTYETYEYNNATLYLVYYRLNDKKISLYPAIRIEADAKRLIKATEHLIELLRAEKNTDPFGE